MSSETPDHTGPPDCAICAFPIGQQRGDGSVEFSATLPCGHSFGSRCLAVATQENETCPTCRQSINVVLLRDLWRLFSAIDGSATGDRPLNRPGRSWRELDDAEAARDAGSIDARPREEVIGRYGGGGSNLSVASAGYIRSPPVVQSWTREEMRDWERCMEDGDIEVVFVWDRDESNSPPRSQSSGYDSGGYGGEYSGNGYDPPSGSYAPPRHIHGHIQGGYRLVPRGRYTPSPHHDHDYNHGSHGYGPSPGSYVSYPHTVRDSQGNTDPRVDDVFRERAARHRRGQDTMPSRALSRSRSLYGGSRSNSRQTPASSPDPYCPFETPARRTRPLGDSNSRGPNLHGFGDGFGPRSWGASHYSIDGSSIARRIIRDEDEEGAYDSFRRGSVSDDYEPSRRNFERALGDRGYFDGRRYLSRRGGSGRYY